MTAQSQYREDVVARDEEVRLTAPAQDMTPHPSTTYFIVAGCVLVGFSFLTGIGNMALLGVAALAVSYLSLRAKPRNDVHAIMSVSTALNAEDPDLTKASLVLDASSERATVIVEASFPGARTTRTRVIVDGQRSMTLESPAVRTGPREQFRIRMMPMDGAGDWFGVWHHAQLPHTLILPARTAIPLVPSSPIARGLTGPKTARRRGDGTEFRDLAPMTWGDSVRNIDWKSSAKNSSSNETLYVRKTFAQAESTAVIVLDSRDDVGPEISTWGSHSDIRADHRSSLDYARTAAVAIAHCAIAVGDRVGFEDLSNPLRPVAPGTGPRHVRRIEHRVALASPRGAPVDRVRAPFVPAGAIVYVLSTFLDDAPLKTTQSLAQRGHRVVLVDVLPQISLGAVSARERQALRLVLLEREARLRACKRLGAPCIPWVSKDAPRELARVAEALRRERRR